MKKLFALVVIMAMCASFTSNLAFAQNDEPEVVGTDDAVADTTGGADAGDVVVLTAPPTDAPAEDAEATLEEAGKPEITGLRQQILKNFIEGNPIFMAMVLLCLILGLALCIERIIYLNMATTNTSKLLNSVEESMKSGGIEGAKEACRNTRGPVASIFYQALDRSGGSAAEVEKSINDYGGVQMALLERGLSWISLFIAIAPMLGFMGTVIGMIGAFQDIEDAGTMSAEIVAGGIKVALITTVSGLVVAIILQIFYNYILSKIDGLVLDMEESSISMVDLVIRHELVNKSDN